MMLILWPLLKYQIGIKCFDQLDDRQDKLCTGRESS